MMWRILIVMMTVSGAAAFGTTTASAFGHLPCAGVQTWTGDEHRCANPRESFKDCPDCPEMVVVPAGSFTMGSPEAEPGREASEGPQHLVRISKPFAVGKLAVTRAEFSGFVAASGYVAEGGCHASTAVGWKRHPSRSWRSPGLAQDGEHPVANIRLCV